MLNAKINFNGVEVYLSGDKDDILYALKNATSKNIPSEEKIIQKASSTIETKPEKKPSLYSREETIKMYEYLASQGNHTIKQFEITRGGKTNPIQYIVCLVFDQDRQRYIHYNPKTEDKYLKSYSIEEVISALKNEQSGFNLLHTVANRVAEKINVVKDLTTIVSKPDPFPKEVKFKNYEKSRIERLREAGRKGAKERWRRARLKQKH